MPEKKTPNQLRKEDLQGVISDLAVAGTLEQAFKKVQDLAGGPHPFTFEDKKTGEMVEPHKDECATFLLHGIHGGKTPRMSTEQIQHAKKRLATVLNAEQRKALEGVAPFLKEMRSPRGSPKAAATTKKTTTTTGSKKAQAESLEAAVARAVAKILGKSPAQSKVKKAAEPSAPRKKKARKERAALKAARQLFPDPSSSSSSSEEEEEEGWSSDDSWDDYSSSSSSSSDEDERRPRKKAKKAKKTKKRARAQSDSSSDEDEDSSSDEDERRPRKKAKKASPRRRCYVDTKWLC